MPSVGQVKPARGISISSRWGWCPSAEATVQGPVEPGECVVTSAGRLRARYVIHAAVMGQDLKTSARLVDRATRNALGLADAYRLESIAFPAFGTGVGGFPLEECARIMIAAIRSHATPATPLRVVRRVLFGRPAYETFGRVADELLGSR